MNSPTRTAKKVLSASRAVWLQSLLQAIRPLRKAWKGLVERKHLSHGQHEHACQPNQRAICSIPLISIKACVSSLGQLGPAAEERPRKSNRSKWTLACAGRPCMQPLRAAAKLCGQRLRPMLTMRPHDHRTSTVLLQEAYFFHSAQPVDLPFVPFLL